MPEALVYREFQSGDAEVFARLNEEWITAFFVMEAEDANGLFHPESEILAPGGHIFLASLGADTVGCCALIFLQPGVYELAKMAVDPRFRGRGFGRELLYHVLKEARALGARTLVLQTSSRLENAIHLYVEAGFHRVPQIAGHQYARADVTMELDLGDDAPSPEDKPETQSNSRTILSSS